SSCRENSTSHPLNHGEDYLTATARKIAVLFYKAVRFGMTYREPGATAYEERHRSRVLANLQRRAKTLGFALAPLPDAEAVS
ncbi:hypothetical protein ACFFIZ_08220, partial [Paracoccus rhizosphaerae]